VSGVVVVGELPVNLGLADEVGEGEDSGGVEVTLALDNFAGGDFLVQKDDYQSITYLYFSTENSKNADTYEEELDVFLVGDKGNLGDLTDNLGGLFTLDLLGVNPLLDGDESGAGTSLINSVTVDLPVGGGNVLEQRY